MKGTLVNKKTTATITGMLVTASLLASPLAATAAPAPRETRSVSITSTSAGGAWQTVDWNQIAAVADRMGDARGAADAREIGDAATHPSTARNIWTSLLKKAVLQVLKHGVSKLPAKIRPYVNKIINVVEEIDSFQQTAVVAALTHAGIPYDVSVATAQWIVFFLGL